MTSFTTRPEIRGTFGVVASTHWIASAVGMSMLERGGNAFDAAVAAGFTLQVVEPHLNGPGGDVPILFQAAREETPRVLCGQGVAPAAATIEAYRARGLDLIPGTGYLAAVVPGAFGAWAGLLRDYGTMSLAEVLAPAIQYARDGYPLIPRIVRAIEAVAEMFEAHWPGSAAIYLPGGTLPDPDRRFRNPEIAAMYQRIVDDSRGAGSREAEIETGLRLFYEGFVAEAICDYIAEPRMDGTGRPQSGLLSRADLANWRASYDDPLACDYGAYRVFKCGAWSQGPAFLQQLALLKGFDVAAMDPLGPDFVHTVVEAAKLAFADREAYYGDPDFVDVPIDALLSDAYNESRRALIGADASFELRPGQVPGHRVRLAGVAAVDPASLLGAGEPTMARYAEKPQVAQTGDTCHVDVIDGDGNMVAATPSGGWLHASPTIPGLGFSLPTRAQMFWLEPGLPASLAPGRRPRTTLSPSLAHRDGKPYKVWGTPGGDQQDQWTLVQFLRHAEHGQNLQQAVDAPLFHTTHFPSSFYPRASAPGRLIIEDRHPAATLDELGGRGHDLRLADGWSIGRMVAAARDEDGVKAAATPRGMQAYAVGR